MILRLLQDPQGTLKLVFLKTAQHRHARSLQAAAVGGAVLPFPRPVQTRQVHCYPRSSCRSSGGLWSITVGTSVLQTALRARGRPGQLGDLLSRSVTASGLHWVAGTFHDKGTASRCCLHSILILKIVVYSNHWMFLGRY